MKRTENPRMKELTGRTAILTGATGGLGRYMARALADEGVRLVLVAFPGAALAELQDELRSGGAEACTVAVDFRNPSHVKKVVEEAERLCGPADILVNNAGIEVTAAYHEMPVELIMDIMSVNLIAPMMLTRAVLPAMVARGRGHVVNISSLAGKAGPAYQAPYAASKSALVGFTSALRATYRGTGVSASVICPGFIEAGIYTRMKQTTGITAPPSLGTSRPERVSRALIRCIKQDLLEVIVNRYPIRPLFAFSAIFPRLGDWLVTKMGAHDFFARLAEAEKRLQNR